MTPETGMHPGTIREKAELMVEDILERQARIDLAMDELREKEFGSYQREKGYEEPAQLVDTRVKSVRRAVRVDSLKAAVPPSANSVETVLQSRKNLENIISGDDDKLIVIAGPCSIHNPEEALEYADWLAGMREEFGGELEIIMRAYLEKPRSGPDWKGLINDPDLNGKPNISLGLTMGRLLLCDITNKGVPVAIERVDARTTQYFDDLSTYDAIGARDIESTRARNYLSVTSAVGGAKNPTDGDMKVAVQAVITANAEHTYLGDDEHGVLAEIESTGNDTVHIVHRGGKDGPNYSAVDVEKTKNMLQEKGLRQALVIDASHANSGKDATRQIVVVRDVSQQVGAGEKAIVGVMIESNLVAGEQSKAHKLGQLLEYGKSITDACVDLNETHQMFRMLAGAVMSKRTASQYRV